MATRRKSPLGPDPLTVLGVPLAPEQWPPVAPFKPIGVPTPYAQDVERPSTVVRAPREFPGDDTESAIIAQAEEEQRRRAFERAVLAGGRERIAQQEQRGRVSADRPGGVGVRAAIRSAGEMAEYALRPDEAPELQAELDLQRGLTPYQRAGVDDFSKIGGARLQAMATRLYGLAEAATGQLAGFATSKALEGYAAMSPDEWDGDEDIYLAGSRFTPAERREWRARWEEDDKHYAEMLDGILTDAVKRSDEEPFLQNVVDNGFEFAEATFDLLSWMSGGDIPKEFWQESTSPERKHVIESMAQTVLEKEAEKRWPEMGNEIVAFVQALYNNPTAVASAYPVATGFLLYPLARRGLVKMSKGAKQASRRVYDAVVDVAEGGGTFNRAAGVAAAVLDASNELWAGFQRWKVDPSKMADPAMQKLASALLDDTSKAEAAVANMGTQLARAMEPPPVMEPPPLKARAGRPVYEEIGSAIPDEGVPPGAGFSFKDVPGGELPEVAATRAAMRARRAGPEGALTPEVLERGTPLAPTDTPLPPQPQPLGLPAPGQVPPRVGKYTLSPEAEAIGLKLLDMDTPWLRQMASDAFKGRAPTQLDRAALAEALAYLTDSVRHFPNPQSARAALMQMMERAGGDPFVAAERAFRAQETAAGARMVGQAERVVQPEPVADLPEVAATRQAMGARRQAPAEPPPAEVPPDVNIPALRERARAAIEESREYNRALVDRVERARSQGQPRAIVERLMEEALADETSYLLRQRAHEAQRMLNEADAAMREGVPTGRGMVPFEEPPVTPEPAVVQPGYEMARWYRPDRKAYEPPRVAPGLQAPSKERGFKFDQRHYELTPDGKLKRVVERTPEGVERVVPPTEISKQPSVRNITPEMMRIIDDNAEVLERGVLSDVPGFRRRAQEELQLSMVEEIANNLQQEVYRKGMAKRLATRLRRETRRPVDERGILQLLEEAADGKVTDRSISYTDVNGQPRRLSVIDEGAKALQADPEFRAAQSQGMVKANFRRLSVAYRKLSHQKTAGRTLERWHPDGLPMAQAIKHLPSPRREAAHVLRRYLEGGELPPTLRNAPESLLAEAVGWPAQLKRRVQSRMKEVPPHILEDVLGLMESGKVVGARDVVIPKIVLNSGTPGARPQLWMKGDLLSSLEWLGADRGWISGRPEALAGTVAHRWFDGFRRFVKKGRVALNPGSHANAWLSNSASAALIFANPLAWVDAIRWGMDFRRWQQGLKAREPVGRRAPMFTVNEKMEAAMRGNFLDSGFTKTELPSKALTIKAADELSTRMRKRGLKAVAMDQLANLFDLPDNVFKGWMAFKIVDKFAADWRSLPEGKWLTIPIGRQREFKAFKRPTEERGMSDMVIDGKQLTRVQMLDMFMRSAGGQAARTFVNFNEVPLIQVAKRGTPLWDAVAGTPFSGWSSVTTTVPGRQGIVGEIMAGPSTRGSTNHLPLMLKRNAEAAVHGLKMSSVLGSQAAQLDDTSSLFRLAKAFSPDEAKPVIADPAGEEGLYNVWSIGNASPFEDIPSTARLLDVTRSAFDWGLGLIDPTELSYLSDEEREQLASITPEEYRSLEPHQKAVYKAAKGLADAAAKGGGFGLKTVLDSTMLSGSAVGEAIIMFANGRGYMVGGRELLDSSRPWDMAAAIGKWSMRTWVPGAITKLLSAGAEAYAADRKVLRDRILADESIPEGERDERARDVTNEIALLDFMSGTKYRPPPEPDPGVDKMRRDFTSILLDHMFSLPRLEMMVGEGTVTEDFLKKHVKKPAQAAVNAVLRAELRALEEEYAKMERQYDSAPEDAALQARMNNLDAHIERLTAEFEEFEAAFELEMDARVEMLRDHDKRRQDLVRGINNAVDNAAGTTGGELQ